MAKGSFAVWVGIVSRQGNMPLVLAALFFFLSFILMGNLRVFSLFFDLKRAFSFFLLKKQIKWFFFFYRY
jgi:hypothetical protein